MAATEWHSSSSDTKRPGARAYAISGVFDLTPMVQMSKAQDLRLDEAEARRASPMHWPAPKGRASTRWSAGQEFERVLAAEPRHCRYVGRAGAETRFEEIAGAKHFTSVDTMSDPQSAMVGRLAELAQKTPEPIAPRKDGRQQRPTTTISARAPWRGIMRYLGADESADEGPRHHQQGRRP